MKSLRLKIFLSYVPIIVAALVVLSFVINFQVRNVVTPMVRNSSQTLVTAYGKYLGEWFQARVDDMRSFSEESVVKTMDWKKIDASLKSVFSSYPEYGMFFIAQPDGTSWSSIGAVANISDRKYFQDVMKDGKDYSISDPILSKATGKPIFVITYAVKNPDGRTVGLFGATVKLSTLSQMVSQIKVGKNGFAWIVDGTGTVIAHPDKGIAMKLNVLQSSKQGYKGFEKLGEMMVKNEPGQGTIVQPTGRSAYLTFTPIPDSPGWTIGFTVPENQFFEASNQILNLILIVAILIIAIMIVVSLIVGRSITGPIIALSNSLRRIGEGDFTVDFTSKSKDEIGKMADSLNQMTGKTRNSFGVIIESSNRMNSSSETLLKSSEEISSSAEDVSSSAERVNANVQSVSASMEEINAGIEEMAVGTQNVAKTSQELSASSDEVLSAAVEGEKNLGDVAGVIKTTTVKMNETAEAVNELAIKAQKVEEIVKTIGAIAEQTNLLALNAAIEAARAGEAGKGFAVVADETRKLAEESKAATSNIADILRQIQDGTKAAYQSTLSTTETVKATDELAEQVQKSFRKILDKVREMTGMVETVAASSQEQSATSEEMTSAMNEATKSVSEVAGQIREVVDTVNEQGKSVREITESLEGLNEIAESLARSVGKFKV